MRTATISMACMAWVALTGCATAGSAWMAQPLLAEDELEPLGELEDPDTEPAPRTPKPPVKPGPTRAKTAPKQTHVITSGKRPPPRAQTPDPSKLEGRVLGKFRNTYYDFPAESDYEGGSVALKNAKCETIKEVPKGFYETVCVQGSGLLSSGQTVSFNRRDCECAAVCPRTEQKICFDALDVRAFPWGRGAIGKAITPLLTVAVDSSVIPLHTPIYIPEYDGLPRDVEETALHDGCFIAQDRGMKVKGKHIDVFTGQQVITRMWNQLVPSNGGVTVVLDSPRCARADTPGPDSR
jgi:hypothetical protein